MTSLVITTKSKDADGRPFPTDMPNRKLVDDGSQLIDASGINPLPSSNVGRRSHLLYSLYRR
jgi:hypothetical protein